MEKRKTGPNDYKGNYVKQTERKMRTVNGKERGES